MIIQCKNCSRKFVVKDDDIPTTGREVQCGYCSVKWHQLPNVASTTQIEKIKPSATIDNTYSIDGIKASDGKTYKFVGNQWAELLPSGKTGIFAKKKISKELDKITGRLQEKNAKKKQKKRHEVNPSESINAEKKLPDIYKPKGLSFFGYIFLLIIIGFSLIGILKTFETDLINNFQEAEYIFELLDQQLEYIAETFKNIFTIIRDLMNSY